MSIKRECIKYRMQNDPIFHGLVCSLTDLLQTGSTVLSLSDWTDALIMAHEINQKRKLNIAMLLRNRQAAMPIMVPGRHNAQDYKKTALDAKGQDNAKPRTERKTQP